LFTEYTAADDAMVLSKKAVFRNTGKKKIKYPTWPLDVVFAFW
jgi:hypothetical protein